MAIMTWDVLHRWYMPFLWITVSSAIAVPLAAYFEAGMVLRDGTTLGLAYGTGWVLKDEVLASIVPYLLNVGCGIWLFNADGSTRWAAFWCIILGIGKIVAPVALVTMSDVTLGSQHYLDWYTVRILIWFQDVQFFALGLMVWAVFARFVGDAQGFGSQAHAEAY